MRKASQTPTQAKRTKTIAEMALRARIRAKVRAVLFEAEHLALDNERDRRQLERALVEALTNG